MGLLYPYLVLSDKVVSIGGGIDAGPVPPLPPLHHNGLPRFVPTVFADRCRALLELRNSIAIRAINGAGFSRQCLSQLLQCKNSHEFTKHSRSVYPLSITRPPKKPTRLSIARGRNFISPCSLKVGCLLTWYVDEGDKDPWAQTRRGNVRQVVGGTAFERRGRVPGPKG